MLIKLTNFIEILEYNHSTIVRKIKVINFGMGKIYQFDQSKLSKSFVNSIKKFTVAICRVFNMNKSWKI